MGAATPNMAQGAGAVRVLQLLELCGGRAWIRCAYGLLLAGVSITSKFYRLLPGLAGVAGDWGCCCRGAGEHFAADLVCFHADSGWAICQFYLVNGGLCFACTATVKKLIGQ